LQARGVKIQQQADGNAAHPKVGQDLCVVRRKQGGDCLDFQQDSTIDQDIGAEAQWQRSLFISDRNGNLPLERDSGAFQFIGQTFAIDRSEKAWPDMAMNLDRQTNDPVGQVRM